MSYIAQWKTIEGHPDYEVSDTGQVRRIRTVQGSPEGRILRPKARGGYLRARLRVAGRDQLKSIHRLVAVAFIPNPQAKPCVNHLDGNKENNRVDNLEWCTHKENSRHASTMGLLSDRRGENHPNAKLSNAQVREIKALCQKGAKKSRIAARFGTTPSNVRMICRGATRAKDHPA